MLTIEEIEQIKKLKDQGYGAGQISRELGISRSTVKNYLLESESSEQVELPQRTKRSRFQRPQVSDPSTQLKNVREAAETMELEVDIAKGERELQKIKGGGENTEIKKKKDGVEISELEAKTIKVKNDIKRLQREEREEAERESRRELLKKVKLTIIPTFLRNQLPPSLLTIALSEITKVLVPLINLGEMSEQELQIYGKVVRDKIFSDPRYIEIVRSAQRKIIINTLDRCLREIQEMLLEEEQASLNETIYFPIKFQVMERGIAEG